MKTLCKSILLFSCLFIFLGVSGALAADVVRSTADPWEPFVDPNDENNGIALAIISAALATQGYEVEHKFQPWKRALNDVTNGKMDILPGTWMTEERKKVLIYSEPYAVNNIKLIKRKDDPFVYEGIESIDGMKVGTMLGYGYPDEFTESGAIMEPTNEFLFSIKKLVAGRVDFAIEDEIVGKYKISQENPELLEKIEFLTPALSNNPLHVTCGKANPKCQTIIDAFNTGLAEIKDSGKYDEIMKSYGIQ